MTIPLTPDELLKLLHKHKLEPLLEPQSEQIYITLKIEKMEIPIFFVIFGDNLLLQLIAYLPFTVKESTMAATARLLHKINRDLDIPGFGMDEREKLLFFRTVIPCIAKTLDEQLLANFLGTIRLACKNFLGPIGMVAVHGAQ